MPTRRDLAQRAGAFAVAGFGLTAAIGARSRPVVTPYRVPMPGWPADVPPIRIAAIADIHACVPWMPVGRIEDIVAATNRLEPDVIVLLGDYVSAMPNAWARAVPAAAWAAALGRLRARLAVRAVLGNHDWRDGCEETRAALAANGIVVMENDAEPIAAPSGFGFWLAGLGDQRAFPIGRGRFKGVDDLPATLAQVTDDRPVVLLAHEPDIFPEVPPRVGLTLAGHTHGGQANLPFLGRPVVPSVYGERYAYGQIVEHGRHLIVSGGLGCTGLPVRIRVPPEIVVVEIGADARS